MGRIAVIRDVPTGHICIMEGEKGPIEFLSIADYGKERNIKADFLGLTRRIDGVDDGNPMPLSRKWVVTVSTQYGCSMGCRFCDVPKVGPGVNATFGDLEGQVLGGISLHPEVRHTERLNIHFARMGEPSFNPDVVAFAKTLQSLVRSRMDAKVVHPVFTTMLPKSNRHLEERLQEWTGVVKNSVFSGDAGLQLSINSTSDAQRGEMFAGSSLPLDAISGICRELPRPVGRKYALNVALADDFEIDAKRLRRLFDPDRFMVKITPLHVTRAAVENSILTTDGYSRYAPYEDAENRLKAEGFDVLVFIPSVEEDESRITCGNAILAEGGETMILAFAGRMGTGKTTHAGILAESLGVPVHSFAGVIKRGAAEACGFDEALARSQEGKRETIFDRFAGRRWTVREAIASWATAMREERPGIFLDAMRNDIAGTDGAFVIDDVRLPEEVEMLADFAVKRPVLVVKCEPGPDWRPGPGAGHVTETALDGFRGFSSTGFPPPTLTLPKILPDGSFRPLDGNVAEIRRALGMDGPSPRG